MTDLNEVTQRKSTARLTMPPQQGYSQATASVRPDTQVKSKQERKKRKRLGFLSWRLLLVVVLVIGLVGIAGYFYKQYQAVKQNPQIVAQQEIDFLVGKVGKHMKLPQETPTLATVLDKDKLKDQAFFADAQNEDKLLVYTKAQKAILYRLKEDKVINVGPIVLNNNGTSASKDQDSGGAKKP